MRKIFYFILASFSLIFSTSASASSDSWTGLYAGLDFGQISGDANVDYSQQSNSCGANTFQSNSGCSFSKLINNELDSLFTGAHIAYLQDRRTFIFGVQADFNYNLDSQDRFSEVMSGYGDEIIAETEQLASSSFKLLFGMPFNGALGYVSAGPSLALVDTKITQNAIGYIPKPIEETSILPGYSIGAGVKYKIHENWLVGGEYNYTELAQIRKESNLSSCCGGITYPDSLTKADYNYSTFKLSLSYKFD
jgi:opacity protein-like surface antigen